MIPTQPQVRAYNTDHLTDGARHWESAGDNWESVYVRVRNGLQSIGWEGEAADAAMTASDIDLRKVLGHVDHLRATAKLATQAADELRFAQNDLLNTVADINEQGFDVGADWTVTDRNSDIRSYSAGTRLAQAEAYAALLGTKIAAFMALESGTAAQLSSAAAALGTMQTHFGPKPKPHSDIQMLDTGQGPSPGQAPSPGLPLPGQLPSPLSPESGLAPWDTPGGQSSSPVPPGYSRDLNSWMPQQASPVPQSLTPMPREIEQALTTPPQAGGVPSAPPIYPTPAGLTPQQALAAQPTGGNVPLLPFYGGQPPSMTAMRDGTDFWPRTPPTYQTPKWDEVLFSGAMACGAGAGWGATGGSVLGPEAAPIGAAGGCQVATGSYLAAYLAQLAFKDLIIFGNAGPPG